MTTPMDIEENNYNKIRDSGGLNQLHQAFRSSDVSPFDSVHYLSDNEFEQIFIGREEEQQKIVDLLLSTVEDGGCRAIKLKGQGGVGKTTLFNSLKRSLNRERLEGGSKFNRLSQSHEIYATFFPLDSSYENLSFIWKKMFEGLSDQDANFFVDLAVKFLLKLLHLLKGDTAAIDELIGILYAGIPERPASIEFITEVNLKALASQYLWLTTDIQKITSFIDRHKREILLHTETIAGKVFKIDPIQIERIKQYLLVLDINTSMRADLMGDTDTLIKDDNSTIEWYNWITAFSSWVTGKITFFLIGIDEVSKIAASPEQYKTKYTQFMNLLIQFRNRLKKVFFVFIDTTQGWKKLEDFIDIESDYRNQISAFIRDTLELEELPISQAMSVFQRRIQLFWKKNHYEQFTLLPFNQVSLNYISDYKSEKLRETMNLIHLIWNDLKRQPSFKPIFNEFDAMRIVRILSKQMPDDFTPADLHPFEKKMLLKLFWDNRDSTSTAPNRYSLKIEPCLENILKVLYNEHNRNVARVSRPTFTIEGDHGKHKRKPDVYIELFGSEGSERMRAVEIQVKMYRDEQEVKLKELESSFDLIKNGRTDLVAFLMTGKGLAKEAMDAIKTFEMNRFWKLEPLSYEEQVALIFLLYYERITGKAFVNPEHVKRCITGFLKWDKIVEYIKNIPKYAAIKGEMEAEKPEKPIDVKPEKPIDVKPEKPIDVKHEKPIDVKPEKPIDVKPEKPIDVKLEKPIDIKPEKPIEGPPIEFHSEIVKWTDELPANIKDKADLIMEIFKILHMSKATTKSFTEVFLRNRKPEHLTPEELNEGYGLLKQTQYLKRVNKSTCLTQEGLGLLKLMIKSNWTS